jgi:hypothetical protein
MASRRRSILKASSTRARRLERSCGEGQLETPALTAPDVTSLSSSASSDPVLRRRHRTPGARIAPARALAQHAAIARRDWHWSAAVRSELRANAPPHNELPGYPIASAPRLRSRPARLPLAKTLATPPRGCMDLSQRPGPATGRSGDYPYRTAIASPDAACPVHHRTGVE